MTNIGINGFGRMGRLALRAIAKRDDLRVVMINEPHAKPEVLSTLLEFDTTQGRWDTPCSFDDRHVIVGTSEIPVSRELAVEDIDWSSENVDIVLECSGEFRKKNLLEAHLVRGAKKVVVSVPVKDGPPNIVVGVNDDRFDLRQESIVTAASCTTNCVAPIVQVIRDSFGIEHGLFTTIHNPTNTQRIIDAVHSDPRRARAAQLNLIPTSTNSATAITMIFPELKGRLDSIAIRAPVLNASLVDCVFQVARDTNVDQVNAALRSAAENGRLRDILGFETRPLVSSDFGRDPRSAIIDAQSTMMVGPRLVKILAWYDNEWGYVNRMIELTAMVAKTL